MDQLKVIQMNMQKMGEPAHGQDPIDKDLLPVKDLTSLLALEKRLREEADLKKKMVTNTLPDQYCKNYCEMHSI